MAAAPEGAVDVRAVGVADERIDRFAQENAQVLHGRDRRRAQKLKFFSESGIGDAHHLGLVLRRGARASQSSKWLPMPSSMTSRTRPAEARSSGAIRTRDEASISTSIALPRKTRFQPLESIGSAATRSRKCLPCRARKNRAASLRDAW